MPRSSCLEYPAGHDFFVVRRPLVELLEDHCAAVVLGCLEFWTNGELARLKREKSRAEPWIRVSVAQIEHETIETYSRRSIHTALDKLENAGFVKRTGTKGGLSSYLLQVQILNEAIRATTSAKLQRAGKASDFVSEDDEIADPLCNFAEPLCNFADEIAEVRPRYKEEEVRRKNTEVIKSPLPSFSNNGTPLYEPSPVSAVDPLEDPDDFSDEAAAAAGLAVHTWFREQDGKATTPMTPPAQREALRAWREHGPEWLRQRLTVWMATGKRNRDLDRFAHTLTAPANGAGAAQAASRGRGIGKHTGSGAGQAAVRRVQRECTPPPEALEWNKRVPGHAWEIWSDDLDALWRATVPEMNGRFEKWQRRCAELSPEAAKHPMGASKFVLRKCLEEWANILNGQWDWMKGAPEEKPDPPYVERYREA